MVPVLRSPPRICLNLMEHKRTGTAGLCQYRHGPAAGVEMVGSWCGFGGAGLVPIFDSKLLLNVSTTGDSAPSFWPSSSISARPPSYVVGDGAEANTERSRRCILLEPGSQNQCHTRRRPSSGVPSLHLKSRWSHCASVFALAVCINLCSLKEVPARCRCERARRESLSTSAERLVTLRVNLSTVYANTPPESCRRPGRDTLLERLSGPRSTPGFFE
ncbi:hypothetical protein C8R46DRAFT_514751 [Mycena filopes]|nr:hypothetical protein C8R46DRAFT_514751 [Mycena filopes]